MEGEIQTFLPLPDFAASARVLDWRRLGKQRSETMQILRTIRGESEGWRNHPAVRMWIGYAPALINYDIDMCEEWRRRGYHDTALDYFLEHLADCPDWDDNMSPPWLGRADFHASHRAALLAKDPAWYGQFGWSEAPAIDYIWPTTLAETV